MRTACQSVMNFLHSAENANAKHQIFLFPIIKKILLAIISVIMQFCNFFSLVSRYFSKEECGLYVSY